jgi:hypothetical protein
MGFLDSFGGLTGDAVSDPGREAAARDAAADVYGGQGGASDVQNELSSLVGLLPATVNIDSALPSFMANKENFTFNDETGEHELTEQGKANMSKDRDDGGLGYWSMSNTADEGMTVAEVAMLGLENAQTGESVLNETTYSPLGLQASHVYASTEAGKRMGLFQTGFGMLAGFPVGAIGTLAGALEGSTIASGILDTLGMQRSSDVTGQGLLDYMGWRSPEDKYGFAAPGAFDGSALGGSVDPASAGDFTGAGSYSSAASGASPGPDLDFIPTAPDPTPPVDDAASSMMYGGPTHIYGAFPAQPRRRGAYQYVPPTFGPPTGWQ